MTDLRPRLFLLAALLLAGGPVAGCVTVAAPDDLVSLRSACVGGELRACDALVTQGAAGAETLRTEVTAVVTLGGACETGYGPACTELGRRLRAGFTGLPGDPERAAAQFAKGCHAGERSSCAELGLAFFNGEGVAEDEAFGLEMMWAACDAQDAVGCYYVALVDWQSSQDGEEAVVASRARELASRACQLGHAAGCVELGGRALRGEGMERHLWLGRWALSRACDLKVGEGCLQLGRVYELGRGIEVDDHNAELRYGDACNYGEPRGCVALAEVLWRRSGELERFEQLCDGGVASACTARGRHGRLEERGEWFDRACARGDRAGCAYAIAERLGSSVAVGGVVSSGAEDDDALARQGWFAELATMCEDGREGAACALLGRERGGQSGLALLREACALESEEGCWWLGQLLADEAPQEADQALRLACELGQAEACLDLAQESPDVDEALALYDRGCRSRSGEACREAGMLRLWARGEEELDGALADLERACALGDEAGCAELARLRAVRAAGDRAEVGALVDGARVGGSRRLDGAVSTME